MFFKVDELKPCKMAEGKPLKSGYGHKWYNGDRYYAHRLSYMLTYGKIPSGYEIHHLCHERFCIEPTHLVALTKSEHMLAHDSYERIRSINADRTHCRYGHELVMYGGRRRCATCERSRNLVYARKQISEHRDEINARKRELRRLKKEAI